MPKMKIPKPVAEYMYHKYGLDRNALWNLIRKFKHRKSNLNPKEISMLNDFSEYYNAIQVQLKVLENIDNKNVLKNL